MKRLLPLLALPLGGCETAERGLITPHQPVVAGNVATVPGCPQWRNLIGGERESQSSNFGCATMSNIAAMVADPQDLLHGRTTDGSGAGETAYKAVQTWRYHIPTGTRWVTGKGGGQQGGGGSGGGGQDNGGGGAGGGNAGGNVPNGGQ